MCSSWFCITSKFYSVDISTEYDQACPRTRRRTHLPISFTSHSGYQLSRLPLFRYASLLFACTSFHRHIQTRSGMEEWKKATGRIHISHWCHDLWNIWVVVRRRCYPTNALDPDLSSQQIVPVSYLAGAILLPRQYYQERHGLNPGSGNYVSLSRGSPTSHVIFEESDEFDKTEGRRGFESMDITHETAERESNVPLLNAHQA